MRKVSSEDFLIGAHYALRGIGCFFGKSNLISKAVVPFFVTSVIYLALMYFGFRFRDWIYLEIDQLWDEYLALPEMFGFLVLLIKRSCGIVLFFVLFAVLMLVGVWIFELLCTFNRCNLPVEYARMVDPEKEICSGEVTPWRLFLVAFYNVWTLLFFVLACALLFWLPVIGQLITVLFLSYRLAIAFLAVIGYRYDVKMSQTASSARHYLALTMGYGVALYVCFAVPYIGGLLLPGVYLGGVMIYNDYFRGDETLPDLQQDSDRQSN